MGNHSPQNGGRTNIQDIQKASRTTYIEVGDTLFTVISVENEKAKEHLYDKIKRLVLNYDLQSDEIAESS